MLAGGKVIDTQTVDINTQDSVYPIDWGERDVWSSGKRIVYTIETKSEFTDYVLSTDTLNTQLTFTHSPTTVSVQWTVNWLDNTEVRYVYNALGNLVRTYNQIDRADLNIQILADGKPVGDVIRIDASEYGSGEKLNG